MNIGHPHCAVPEPQDGRPNAAERSVQNCSLIDQIKILQGLIQARLFIPDLTIRNPSVLRQALQHYDTTFYLTSTSISLQEIKACDIRGVY